MDTKVNSKVATADTKAETNPTRAAADTNLAAVATPGMTIHPRVVAEEEVVTTKAREEITVVDKAAMDAISGSSKEQQMMV